MSDLNKHSEFVQVQVQVKRPRRFKAGSEIDSTAVNLVIDIESEADRRGGSLRIKSENGESEDFKLQLTIENGSCKG